MRARLVSILTLLLVCTLAAISVPLAFRFASGDEQAMFLDRRQDTSRFANIAEQNVDTTDGQALQGQLARYYEVYGVAAAIVNPRMAPESGAGNVDLASPAVSGALRIALSGHDSAAPSVLSLARSPQLVVAVPIVRGDDVIGAALTVSPTAQLRAAFDERLRELLAADLAVVALFVLVAMRLGTWVLHPVGQLDSAIVRINGGDLATRVPVQHGPVELRRLAASFNLMVEAVQRAMDSQQAFVANAAHQLRNPLTALTLRLESLRLDAQPEHRDDLDEILGESARLNAILNQLLELATVQGGPAVQRHLVDVVCVVRGRAAAWEEYANKRGIRFALDHPAQATACSDVALVSSIIDAVFDNAVKYSPVGGAIAVDVREEGRQIRVETADCGPGVPPGELEKLGERFWRSPSTAHVPGSGLGLTIALELAGAVGGRLRFEPVLPHGLRVLLDLPAAVDDCEGEPL
jgi:signal transduction histidine kinase